MSLSAMAAEIRSQVEDLPRFAKTLKGDGVRIVDPSKAVFTGSGDSYACALFARSLTGGLAFADDPHELARNSTLARGKTIVIISVSGRTGANVKLARVLKRTAKRRIAVTSQKNSPLAEICDETILLRYKSGGGC